MNKLTQKIKENTSKIASKIATTERDFWPPICIGPFFQPERPERSEDKKA